MSAIFGGYRTQVYHEVVQRIAMALKGKVSDDSQAALVPLPEDTKVTRVLKNVPGLVDMAIPDGTDHHYMRHVTVKRPKRNAVRFTVIRESSRNEHSYVIRSFQEGRA